MKLKINTHITIISCPISTPTANSIIDMNVLSLVLTNNLNALEKPNP